MAQIDDGACPAPQLPAALLRTVLPLPCCINKLLSVHVITAAAERMLFAWGRTSAFNEQECAVVFEPVINSLYTFLFGIAPCPSNSFVFAIHVGQTPFYDRAETGLALLRCNNGTLIWVEALDKKTQRIHTFFHIYFLFMLF